MREVKRGEIYYANLYDVTGSEQGGKRPVLILQNDIGNQFSPTTIVAAITSKEKPKQPTHVSINSECLPKQSIVLLEQIRTIDKTRLCEYIGNVNGNDIKRINKAIVVSFGLKYLEGDSLHN